MLQMTVGDLKAQFSMVLQQIKAGNDVEILYGRSKKPVARITGVEKVEKKAPCSWNLQGDFYRSR